MRSTGNKIAEEKGHAAHRKTVSHADVHESPDGRPARNESTLQRSSAFQKTLVKTQIYEITAVISGDSSGHLRPTCLHQIFLPADMPMVGNSALPLPLALPLAIAICSDMMVEFNLLREIVVLPINWGISMRKLILAFLSAHLLAWPVMSLAEKINEVPHIYRSARHLSRGDTGISRTQDQEAIFYNPAGLSLCSLNGDSADAHCKADGLLRNVVIISPTIEASSGIGEFSKLGTGSDSEKTLALTDSVGVPGHVGLYNFSGVVGQSWAAGLLASSNASLLLYRNPDLSSIETVDARIVRDVGPVGSYSLPLLEKKLTVGTTVKVLHRTQTLVDLPLLDVEDVKEFKLSNYTNSGTGFGVDLGVIYQFVIDPTSINVGLTLLNLGDTNFSESKSNDIQIDAIKQTLNLGVSAKYQGGYGTSTAHLDLLDLTRHVSDSFIKGVHMGIDHAMGIYGVGVGLNQGYPTAGVYLESRYARLDIGMSSEEMGDFAGDRTDPRYHIRLGSQL